MLEADNYNFWIELVISAKAASGKNVFLKAIHFKNLQMQTFEGISKTIKTEC
jgi:hypothetical protein